jgi:hypothetical protein
MDPRDERANIFHLDRKGLTPMEVKQDMDGVLGETAPSYDTIKYWHRQFKCGRTSTASQPSTGHPQVLDMEQFIPREHHSSAWWQHWGFQKPQFSGSSLNTCRCTNSALVRCPNF